MQNRITLLNCPIDSLTMQQTIEIIEDSIVKKKPIHHTVVNAVKLVNIQKDPILKESVVNCDIINADGQGVVLAAAFLNKPLPERVAGIDLMLELISFSAKKGYKIFFFGAKEEVVKKVVEKFSTQYGPQIIAGYRNGYYTNEEEPLIAQQIADSKADILFVAMTSPKKEIFLNTYKLIIQAPFIMGVGGSFDVVSGKLKRAPKWMQKIGLEGVYRVILEPKNRWKRLLFDVSEFIWLIFKEKIKLVFKR